MKNIAITGSFASGKSFVLNSAKNLGYRIFSCDNFVRKAYEDIKLQTKVVNEIKGLGLFDKRELSRIIYDNPESRRKLESIINPKVRSGIKKLYSLKYHYYLNQILINILLTQYVYIVPKTLDYKGHKKEKIIIFI